MPRLALRISQAILSLLLLTGFASLVTAALVGAIVKTYENDTVLLPCHVEDLGGEESRSRVRWWKSDVLLADSEKPTAGASGSRIRMWENRSLEIVEVRPVDSGKYVCQATRPEPWGHVTQAHEIEVIYPARLKLEPESGLLEVTLSEEAEMHCVAEGIPKPELTWSFQGEELPVLASGQRLRIHATNRSLAGLYTCQASNGIGEPARASIELRIRHKPEVSGVSVWVHSAPGIRTKLHCVVVAWPEAQLEWLFEGRPLARSARLLRYKQDEPSATGGAASPAQLHSLVIRSLEAEDLGTYTCRASNELGTAEATIQLSGAPRAPLLKKVRPSSETSYNFIWEVDSYSPIVEYLFWFRQEVSEASENWRRLTIPSADEPAGPLHALSFNLTGLQPSRQYEAFVLARNHFGWSVPSNIVRFASAPNDAELKEETQGVNRDSIEKSIQMTPDSHELFSEVNSSDYFRPNVLALTLLVPALAFSSVKVTTTSF